MTSFQKDVIYIVRHKQNGTKSTVGGLLLYIIIIILFTVILYRDSILSRINTVTYCKVAVSGDFWAPDKQAKMVFS